MFPNAYEELAPSVVVSHNIKPRDLSMQTRSPKFFEYRTNWNKVNKHGRINIPRGWATSWSHSTGVFCNNHNCGLNKSIMPVYLHQLTVD